MERQPVSSSTILSVGYDEISTTLEIEFRSGGIYQYSSVPSSIYLALMTASSKGGYHARHIKRKYRHRRLRRGN